MAKVSVMSAIIYPVRAERQRRGGFQRELSEVPFGKTPRGTFMDKLIELERVLDNLDFLADTFCAIDLANQNRAFSLPECALTLPAEMLKTYTEKAKTLYAELLKSGTA